MIEKVAKLAPDPVQLETAPPPPWLAIGRAQALGLLFVLAALVMLFQGFRIVDPDLPVMFRAIDAGHAAALPPDRGFLLEGVLNDVVGIFITRHVPSDLAAALTWSAAGLAALVAALALSLYDGSISPLSVVLVFAFSRTLDTIYMWIGKFDPFLIAFLILSINKRQAVAFVATLLACLSHPMAPTFSALGVFAVRGAILREWRWLNVAGAAIGYLVDSTIFHQWLPTLHSRVAYAADSAKHLMTNTIRWGPQSLAASVVLPVGSLCLIAWRRWAPSDPRFLALVGWLLLVVLTSCVLTLDHTRVAALIMLAPMLVYMNLSEDVIARSELKAQRAAAVALLFAARLVVPHFDSLGGHSTTLDGIFVLLGRQPWV